VRIINAVKVTTSIPQQPLIAQLSNLVFTQYNFSHTQATRFTKTKASRITQILSMNTQMIPWFPIQ